MNKTTIIVLMSLVGLLQACSSPINYGSDFRSGIDFSSMETYGWHAPNEYNEITNNFIANEIVDDRIRANVDAQMRSKGFTRVPEEEADFLVNYSITTQDQIDIHTYNTYSGYAPGWGFGASYGYYGYPYRYYGLGVSPVINDTETRITEYTQGTFVLDIVSAGDDLLLWRGTAEGRMPRQQLTGQEREEVISEVVSNVLTDFPPGQQP